MGKKISNLIHSKSFLIVLIILLITLVVATTTYAWFTWSSTNNTSITMSIGESSEVVFASGNNITTSSLNPVFNYTDGEDTSFKIVNKSKTIIDYKVILNITSIDNELKSDSLKYVLVKDNTIIKEDSFTNITTGNTTLYESSITGSSNNFIFYLYIDGNIENSNSLMNKNITGTITVEAEDKSLAGYITKLYTNSTKTTATVNNITYNLASSVGLMNDRYGSMSTNIDSGNIRYYGASPNNYIYFNCSDYSNQTSTTCEKWRIIGVFNGKVKIIRNETIGEYSWHTSESSISGSDWAEAKLMKLLNSGYESESVGGSLYWSAGSGSCYFFYEPGNVTKSCDFTSTGLKNTTTRNLISESTWSLLGHNTSSVYTDVMYNIERTTGSVVSGHSSSWTGKVALAYPSDYGYAADLSQCNQTLYNYSNSTCRSNNWMIKINTDNETSSWLLTPVSSGSVWNCHFYGNITHDEGETYDRYSVYPTIYLNSEQAIRSGDGSSNSPYKLSVT